MPNTLYVFQSSKDTPLEKIPVAPPSDKRSHTKHTRPKHRKAPRVRWKLGRCVNRPLFGSIFFFKITVRFARRCRQTIRPRVFVLCTTVSGYLRFVRLFRGTTEGVGGDNTLQRKINTPPPRGAVIEFVCYINCNFYVHVNVSITQCIDCVALKGVKFHGRLLSVFGKTTSFCPEML